MCSCAANDRAGWHALHSAAAAGAQQCHRADAHSLRATPAPPPLATPPPRRWPRTRVRSRTWMMASCPAGLGCPLQTLAKSTGACSLTPTCATCCWPSAPTRWGGGGVGGWVSGWRVGGHRSAMCWCPRRVGVRRPPRGGGLGMLRTPLSRPGLPHVRQPHLLLTAPRRRQPLCTGLRARTLNQQLTPAALCCSVFNPLAPRARERPPPGPPYFVSSFLRRWLCARVPREAWRLPLPPLAHPPPPRAV